ncbi:MAG TPA: homoserine kinase [Azospira sp.]|nr:homoserine kinase [Azospira sp.]
MSVFTPVTREQLQDWLPGCAVGTLVDFAGIAAGVQNTNYFVTSTQGKWVLTLFETLAAEELGFYLGLMAHLAARGLPCPAPVAAADGAVLRPLAGRPAVLVSRLQGREVAVPGAAHAAAVGEALARLHLAARDFRPLRPNPRGAAWRQEAAAAVLPCLSAADRALLQDEMAWQEQPQQALPRGIVHADLFRDNVLFDGERLAGLLDFYFAGEDDLLFDLAVAANDWCVAADGRLDPQRTRALLAAYQRQRPLTPAEALAWPRLLRRAALRFWLSRLEDFHLPRPGRQVLVKDPEHFRHLLLAHRQPPLPPWLA